MSVIAGMAAASVARDLAKENSALRAEIARLQEALKPFRGFWSDGELQGLPDCHMFEMVWARDGGEDRVNEETGKRYPAVTAGQLRRARDATLKAEGAGHELLER